MKIKGLMQKFNHLSGNDYLEVLNDKDKVIHSRNVMLRMKATGNKEYAMMKIQQDKIVLTSKHDKMRVLDNNSYAPFVKGLKREDYIVIHVTPKE
jgi:hypothetical protein